MKTGTAMGVMWLQAKEHLEPSEAAGGLEIFSPRAFGGSMAC